MQKILIVDDEVGIRELLSEILSDEGYDILLAENAAKATSSLRENQPDLVLLDIWMPDRDGVTLLKEWKADKILNVPVVMMSGHATIDTAVEATKMGALDCLEKPIPLAKLLHTVKRALKQSTTTILSSASAVNSNEPHVLSSANNARSSTAQIETENGVTIYLTEEQQKLAIEFSELFNHPLREARDQFEKTYFEHLMLQEKGNMSRIAERSGFERTHLYRKFKLLGIK